MEGELPARIIAAARAMAEAAGHDPDEFGQWEGNAAFCHRWEIYIHHAKMIAAALPILLEGM